MGCEVACDWERRHFCRRQRAILENARVFRLRSAVGDKSRKTAGDNVAAPIPPAPPEARRRVIESGPAAYAEGVEAISPRLPRRTRGYLGKSTKRTSTPLGSHPIPAPPMNPLRANRPMATPSQRSSSLATAGLSDATPPAYPLSIPLTRRVIYRNRRRQWYSEGPLLTPPPLPL
ncbi:MAG: hypothetical protein RL088_1178 [Verrucomicrobiota bacterium]|jgi:hypothetical protein